MNLEDWEKLSPEEQQRKLGERPKVHSPSCCAVLETINKQIKEESVAVQNYALTADDLRKAGSDPAVIGVLERLAVEEFSHHLQLIGIAELLNYQCGCGVKKED